MFGHKRRTVGDRVRDRMSNHRPGKLDSAAAAALVLGMGNWLTTSLFNFDAVQAVAGKKSMSGRTLYGLIGLSGLYATMRGARKEA